MAGNEDRAVYRVTGDLSNLSVSRSSLQYASPAPLEGSNPILVSMFHTLFPYFPKFTDHKKAKFGR
jgi:hypothetical protein